MRSIGKRFIFRAAVLGVLALIPGCLGHGHHHETETLSAPTMAEPAAARAMEEGNRLFAAHEWQAAKAQYEGAIQVQPSLAEAHYNLALTLDRLGDPQAARRHYLQAANLAPGHKVIWNSPPLRRHGDVQVESESAAPEDGGGHSH